MSYFFVVLFIMVLLLCALLNLASLPGNWVMLIFVVLWAIFGPIPQGTELGVFFFVVFAGLALLGEAVELLAQIWGGKRFGSSSRATFWGIIGAIAGGILCAPIMFGIGAIFGALAGAWVGSFFSERVLDDKPAKEAVIAANGALIGRFLGTVIKFGLGVTMLIWTATHIWPAGAG